MDYTALITNVGFPAFISYLLIEKMFLLIKPMFSKKENVEEFNSDAILRELKLMNGNHLHTIEDVIVSGNKEIVQAVNDMHIDLIKELAKK